MQKQNDNTLAVLKEMCDKPYDFFSEAFPDSAIEEFKSTLTDAIARIEAAEKIFGAATSIELHGDSLGRSESVIGIYRESGGGFALSADGQEIGEFPTVFAAFDAVGKGEKDATILRTLPTLQDEAGSTSEVRKMSDQSTQERDKLIGLARAYFARHELHEFYSAIAYSGYKHATDKQAEVMADFALSLQRADAAAVKDEWISVESELPETMGDYLTTINAVEYEAPPIVRIKFYRPEILSDGKPFGWEGQANVVAWRKLPEPFTKTEANTNG